MGPSYPTKTEAVRPEQRFTPYNPCPICGGHDGMRRGEGVRCFGFISGDQSYARCTREEHAGDAPRDERSNAWVHKLVGDCKCGVRHDPVPPATLTPNGTRPSISESTSETREERVYVYEDADGKPYLRVHRTPGKDFYQQHWDGSQWRNGLAGREPILYRLPKVLRADPREPAFVVEGEKDAERLARESLLATTNPMGAGKWRDHYAEVLKGRTVYVVADNDAAGEKHAEQVAASIPGARIVRLDGLPPKGDVSDWLDAGHSAEELLEIASREPERPRERFPRVDLAEAIESGPKPPAMLVPGIIYAALVHGLYSAGGMGKSWLALWIIKQVIEQGEDVILLDLENGVRIISDRLREMGVDPALVRRHLIYVPFPSMPLSVDAIAEFVALLEGTDPALVVIDSWINCLAAAGLDENSAVDIATWAEAYPQKARSRGIAVLILDHIPKEGGSARGSGRKLDYVDAMWELRSPVKFDRKTVGRIDLRLRKDREGWLPRGLTFSAGAGDNGFEIKLDLGAHPSAEEATGLLRSDETTLEALRAFRSTGAFDKEWREETMDRGLSRATYYRSRETLLRLGLVEQVMDKFFLKDPAKPRSHEVSKESHETS